MALALAEAYESAEARIAALEAELAAERDRVKALTAQRPAEREVTIRESDWDAIALAAFKAWGSKLGSSWTNATRDVIFAAEPTWRKP